MLGVSDNSDSEHAKEYAECEQDFRKYGDGAVEICGDGKDRNGSKTQENRGCHYSPAKTERRLKNG